MTVSIPKPKYLTVAVAAKRLQCEEDEILYYIEQQMLRCVVFIRYMRLLIISDSDEKPRSGLATCSYRGLLLVTSDLIRNNLLDTESEKFMVGSSRFRILERSGISNWSMDEVFTDTDLKPTYFNHWHPTTFDQFDIQRHQVYFMPTKTHQPELARFSAEAVTPGTGNNVSPYIYMMDQYHSIRKCDLRILTHDLERLGQNNHQPEFTVSTSSSAPDVEDQLTSKLKERVYDHHVTIERAFLLTGKGKARTVWNALKEENEVDPDSPQYDKDRVILEVGRDSIDLDPKNKTVVKTTMVWVSFRNLVSRLRTEHESHS